MFCSRCNTPFEILPILEGKSKYCKKCGNLIYKKEYNSIIINNPDELSSKQDEEQELRERISKEKEIRFKEQLERKEKEKEFRERLEQERLIKEKEEKEQKLKEIDEQKKALQQQLEEENRVKEEMLKIQLEKINLEKKQEEEALKIKELKKKEQTEKEKKEKIQFALADKERIKKEKKFHLKVEEENRKSEQLLKDQAEAEKKEREKLEQEIVKVENKKKEQRLKHEINETVQIHLTENKENTIILKKKSVLYSNIVLYTLLVIVVVLLTQFLWSTFKSKNTLKNKVVANELVAVDSTPLSPINLELYEDTSFIEQLKFDLLGKEILSWDSIKNNEIKKLTLLSGTENKVSSNYLVSVNIEDMAGTKATAEINLHYNNSILNTMETTKITYSNIAPIYAWYSFKPIPNCAIFINTNNNPIKLKPCDSCTIMKMVSNKETLVTIVNASNISIKSDNKYDAIIEFTYVPIKNN